jgi:surfactin synthase thioesterase subunit
VYFLPFSEKELEELVEKELQKWKEKVYKIIYDSLMDADHFFTTDQAKARNNLEISWTKDVNKLLTAGYDVHYGCPLLIGY